jgi:hypothetical protein
MGSLNHNSTAKRLPVRDFTIRGPLWSSSICTSYQPWQENNESSLHQTNYASYANESIFIMYQWQLIDPSLSMHHINDNLLIHLHRLVSTWHLSFSSRTIHIHCSSIINQSLDIQWHQSINDINQSNHWHQWQHDPIHHEPSVISPNICLYQSCINYRSSMMYNMMTSSNHQLHVPICSPSICQMHASSFPTSKLPIIHHMIYQWNSKYVPAMYTNISSSILHSLQQILSIQKHM